MPKRDIVTLVAVDFEQATQRAALAALEHARFDVRRSDGTISSANGIFVLFDDAALPQALYSLISLMPGRAIFPNVILVVENAPESGALLAEGFHDVVSPSEVAVSIDQLIAGKPPIFLRNLRRDIDQHFFADLRNEQHQRVLDKQRFTEDAVDILRALQILEKKRHRLEKRVNAHYIDAFLVDHALLENYHEDLAAKKARQSPLALPRPPKETDKPLFAGKKEVRLKRVPERLGDIIEGLLQLGVLQSVSPERQRELVRYSEEYKSAPLAGLRAAIALLRTDLSERQANTQKLSLDMDVQAELQRRCLDRYDFGFLAPGFVLPRHILLLIESLAQPPAEFYLIWTLDVRTLSFQLCGDIIGEIARALARTTSDFDATALQGAALS